MSLRIGSLFTGYGGLDLAVEDALGGAVVWHADNDPAASAVLAYHQPDVPNLGDVTAIDWTTTEPVDVLTGGFPCQDLSLAGRRVGLAGARSGLWEHMARAIDALRPGLVVIENVRGLLSAPAAAGDLEPCPWCVGDRPTRVLRALGAVLGELADLGYDAAWCGLAAADIGAPHARFRVFLLAHRRAAAAHADDLGRQRPRSPRHRGAGPAHHGDPAAHAPSHRRGEGRAEPAGLGGGSDAALGGDRDWGPYGAAIHRWEQLLGRRAPAPTRPGRRGGEQLAPAFVEWPMGLPAGHVTAVPGLTRNDQLRLLGNGVVPQQATAALATLLPRTSPALAPRHDEQAA
ncbi:DNA cytosine methyltransferase [Saccharopolyspora rosea]|uniref:DNA cytosine methyltransferase n=1 Tax=Saccharopolyspora rosea TaxID=524884 RepID=UPI0021D8E634|nr:DNA (cytosine-5-)-methyltransferase [Saccharopolyspora rosea]